MNVTKRKIESLTLDPENARKHPERQLATLCASLDQFGQRKPIVVTKAGLVLAGNGTVQAAIALGWTEVLVTVAPDDWDEATAKAFALADNRTAELAEWDTSILADQLLSLQEIGWDIEAFGFAPFTDPEPVEAPEDFPSFDDKEATTHMCPKCGYEWNGSSR